MKASELVSNLQKMIETSGDLDIYIPKDESHEEVVGLFQMVDEEDQESEEPDYFLLCDDDTYDTLHVGEEDEESEIPETDDTEEIL